MYTIGRKCAHARVSVMLKYGYGISVCIKCLSHFLLQRILFTSLSSSHTQNGHLIIRYFSAIFLVVSLSHKLLYENQWIWNCS